MDKYFLTPPSDIETIRMFPDLEKAKTAADGNSIYGYVVRDIGGNIVYNPNPTLIGSIILYNAKKVADYIRDHEFVYGHAQVNPALDHTEKVVSCDRFAAWSLHRSGFDKGHPEKHGFTLYGAGNLESFLIANGFERIDDMSQLIAGDIVFVGTSYELEALADDWKPYPAHVYVNASSCNSDGFSHRYDGGSIERIRSTQPSFELASTPPRRAFRFAYRAKEKE